MYAIHQQVIAKIQRCARVGGGYAEIIGTVIGIINAPYRDWETDRKSTRLNSSHEIPSRMPSSA